MGDVRAQQQPGQPMGVCVLWLEVPDEGTAPGYHLEGTLERVRAVQPEASVTVVARSGGWVLLDHLRTFSRFVAEVGHCDVVICRWHVAALPSVALAKLHGKRVALLVQGTVDDMLEAHGLLRFLPVRALARHSFRLATVIAVPHEGIGRWVVSVAGRVSDPVLLPNRRPVYDPHSESTAERVPERPYAIFIGSLATWQGLGVLLDAHDSSDWPDGVRLVIVGDGPERWRLEGRCRDGVTWLGHLPPRRARPLLRRALCSVSPKIDSAATRNGTSPFKLLEAVDERTPYVASDVPGQREFVADYGGGLLVPPGDPHRLAQAVSRLHTDAALSDRLHAEAAASRQRLGWSSDVKAFARLLGGSPPLPRATSGLKG